MNPVDGIIRQVNRKNNLNILCAPTHERYETGLAETGHNFYAYRAEGIKDWNETYAKKPKNYTLLKPNTIPFHIDFDLVLSQNKFGQFQALYPIAKHLQIPLISLEHTLPVPQWNDEIRYQLTNMRGEINVFISEYSLGEWRWKNRNDTTIVHHGVDSNIFNMNIPVEDRKPLLCSVVNDWINRDWACGFRVWQNITRYPNNSYELNIWGDTPRLSKPAKNIQHLVSEYNRSLIYLNTSLISPIPTALLEAMSCGCVPISTATCMIPEIIDNGKNGFISNDIEELRQYIDLVIKDKKLAQELSHNAVETIKTKFSKEKFVNRWNEIFNYAKDIIFAG